MATPVEELIKQLRKSKESGAILVPLIEEFLRKPCDVEDKLDRKYLRDLVKTRSRPRKVGVYSPSQLASCVRQVYFTKTGKERNKVTRIASSGYFLDGNFRHFKWQFVLWKMHRAGIIQLIGNEDWCLGTEIFVLNNKGDYGGTIDQLVYIPQIDWLGTVDYKGMNSNAFMSSVSKGPSVKYITQSVGYAMIANEDESLVLPKSIDEVVIIGENKNGPLNNRYSPSPLGLHEWRFNVNQHRQDVTRRLKKLRAHERKLIIPAVECKSTRSMQFMDCAFNKFCRVEIEKNERARMSHKLALNGKSKKDKFNFEPGVNKDRKQKRMR